MTLLSKDRIGALILLVFCAAFGWLSQDITLLPFQANQAFTARTMPEALSVLGVVLALLLLIQPGSDEQPSFSGYRWGVGLAFLGLMVLYGFGVRPMGFLISTTLFLIAGFMLLGERRVWMLLGASIPLVVAFWALMAKVLEVYVAPWPNLNALGLGG